MTRPERNWRAFAASIRFRFTLAMLVVVVLPLIAVVVIVGRWNYDSAEEQALRIQQQTAAVVESEVRAKILGVESEMKVLDEVLALTTLDPNEQRIALRNLLANDSIYQQLTLVDLESREEIRVSRTGVSSSSDSVHQRHHDAIDAALSAEASYFGPVFFEDALREPLTTIAVPMQNRRTGETDSVLVATARFKLIWDLLAEVDEPGESDVYVVTDAGLVIAHRNPAMVLSGREIALPSSDGRSTGLSGQNVVIATHPLEVGSQHLVVVAEQDTSIALSVADRTLTVLVGVAIIGLFVTIALFVLLARQILKPIEELAHSANRIADGDLAHRVDQKSSGEIGILARSFNTMTSQLGDVIASLEQRVKHRTDELEQAVALQDELIVSLEAQAARDFLTGLPNRYALDTRLEFELGRARRLGSRVTVLMIDLDHFKDVNDTHGHGVGDELLVAVGDRMKETLREVDLICRVGGDEFAIVQTDIASRDGAAILAERLLRAFVEPLQLGSLKISTGLSIGISISEQDTTSISDFMQQADLALYRSKNDGRNTYRFFEEDMDAETQRRVDLSQDLRSAIERDELFLEYQPQVALRDRRIVGVEALLRWRHPRLGVIAPNELVPIAESARLIDEVGEWVLRTACQRAQSWQDGELPALPVAVNVSAIQLRDPGFADMVSRVLVESGMAPRYLELEINENVLMATEKHVDETLQTLRANGVRLVLDDFGRGLASLDYLRRYPMTKVKIDRSFIQDTLTDAKNAAIVNAIIDLTTELGLQVVAEGVEVAELLDRLSEGGSLAAQGFYFSPPVSGQRLEEIMAAGSDQIRGAPSGSV